MESDEEYYTRRIVQEYKLAAVADSPSVKNLHLEMAAKYSKLQRDYN